MTSDLPPRSANCGLRTATGRSKGVPCNERYKIRITLAFGLRNRHSLFLLLILYMRNNMFDSYKFCIIMDGSDGIFSLA